MRHTEWTDFLTKEEYEAYKKEMDLRRWCSERLKDHDAAIRRLETKAKERRAAVREAAE